jgi:hypothetical protein
MLHKVRIVQLRRRLCFRTRTNMDVTWVQCMRNWILSTSTGSRNCSQGVLEHSARIAAIDCHSQPRVSRTMNGHWWGNTQVGRRSTLFRTPRPSSCRENHRVSIMLKDWSRVPVRHWSTLSSPPESSYCRQALRFYCGHHDRLNLCSSFRHQPGCLIRDGTAEPRETCISSY